MAECTTDTSSYALYGVFYCTIVLAAWVLVLPTIGQSPKPKEQ